MSRKEKWSAFGKNTGNAFKNFGKAMATTFRVAVGSEENTVGEDGRSKLKETWTTTGKGFGEAGKSLGEAAAETIDSKDDNIADEPVETVEEPDIEQ